MAPDGEGTEQKLWELQARTTTTALERMERSIERGFDAVGVRLDRADERLAKMERRQEYDAARLRELERFREEEDRRREKNRDIAEAEAKANVDYSLFWRIFRIAAGATVGTATLVLTILGISGAIH